VRDRESVYAAAAGCEAILHHAAMTSVPRSIQQPDGYIDVNIRGTLNVARVVFASSSSVYGDQTTFPLHEALEPRPRSPYAATKLGGEALVRCWWDSYRVRTLAFRYFNVYGPGQDPESQYAAVIPRFASACLTGRPPVVYGNGEQSRDFTFVEDVVEANMLALAARDDVFGSALNIGGGREPTTVNQLLDLVSAYSDSKPEPLHQPARAGDIHRSHADISRARELLGYEPRVDMSEGIRRTVESYARTV
jgi:UDP-glucose 4-epimerase